MPKKESTTLSDKARLDDCEQHKRWNAFIPPPPDTNPDEGVKPLTVSDSGLYELNSVLRWSDDIKEFERLYEIYNRETDVVEYRLQSNLVSANVIMNNLDKVVADFKEGKLPPQGEVPVTASPKEDESVH